MAANGLLVWFSIYNIKHLILFDYLEGKSKPLQYMVTPTINVFMVSAWLSLYSLWEVKPFNFIKPLIIYPVMLPWLWYNDQVTTSLIFEIKLWSYKKRENNWVNAESIWWPRQIIYLYILMITLPWLSMKLLIVKPYFLASTTHLLWV